MISSCRKSCATSFICILFCRSLVPRMDASCRVSHVSCLCHVVSMRPASELLMWWKVSWVLMLWTDHYLQQIQGLEDSRSLPCLDLWKSLSDYSLYSMAFWPVLGPYDFPLVVLHTLSISFFHLWCITGVSVFEWKATYFSSSRVKTILAPLGMLTWDWPSENQNIMLFHSYTSKDAPKTYRTWKFYAKPRTPDQKSYHVNG